MFGIHVYYVCLEFTYITYVWNSRILRMFGIHVYYVCLEFTYITYVWNLVNYVCLECFLKHEIVNLHYKILFSNEKQSVKLKLCHS